MPRNILIRTSHGIQPFALGRLVGDLMLRYEMTPTRAEEVGRAFERSIEIAHETRRVRVVDAEGLRRGVESLLEGRSEGAVAAELARHSRPPRWHEARFSVPPHSPAVSRLSDAVSGHALHVLAAASMGEGSPDLLEAVDELVRVLRRYAYESYEGTPEAKAVYADFVAAKARARLGAGLDKSAAKEVKISLGSVIRWLIDFLAINEIPTLLSGDDDDGDDPRDTPPPSIFGEVADPGLQLEQSLLQLKALRMTSGPGADEIRMATAFSGFGQSGQTTTGVHAFNEHGDSRAGNGEQLGIVTLPSVASGFYTAVHLLTERDAVDESKAQEIANAVVAVLDKVVGAALSHGLDTLGAMTGIPFPNGVVDLIAGPAITKAGAIVCDKIREILVNALGPELFLPALTRVFVDPQIGRPFWSVWVQGHNMGSRMSPGEIRSFRHPNGMPYVSQRGGVGRYTFQFRFRVG